MASLEEMIANATQAPAQQAQPQAKSAPAPPKQPSLEEMIATASAQPRGDQPTPPQAPAAVPAEPQPQEEPRFNLAADVSNWVQQQPMVQETARSWQLEGPYGLGKQAVQAAENIPAGWASLADAGLTGVKMAQDAAVNNLVPDPQLRKQAFENLDRELPMVRHSHLADSYSRMVNPNGMLPQTAELGRQAGEFGLPVFGAAAKGIDGANLAAKAVNAARKTLSLGGQTGGLNAFLGGTQRYAQNNDIDMEQTKNDFMGGAVAGPLAAATIGTALNVPKFVKGIVGSVTKNFNALGRGGQKALMASVQQAPRPPLEEFLRGIKANPEQLPPDTQAMINQLRGQPAMPVQTPVPVAAPSPPSVPMRPDPSLAKLPRDLEGAKPRYRQWMPKFEHDIDRALYIVGNRKQLSPADDRYYKWVEDATGWDHDKIMSAAKRVQEAVKASPRTGNAEFPVRGNAFKFGKQSVRMPTEHAKKFISEIVDDAARATDPVMAAENIQEWADNLTGKKVDLDESSPGEFRRTISQEFHGRNKNKLAEPLHGHAYMDSREMRQAVHGIATAKVNRDYTEAVLNKYERQYWDRFVEPKDQDATEYTTPIGLKLRRGENMQITAEAQHQIDAKRFELATDIAPTKHPGTEVLMTQKFGKGPRDAHLHHEIMPDNEEMAARKLLELHDRADASDKEFRLTKTTGEKGSTKEVTRLEAKLEKARAKKAPDAHEITNLEQQLAQTRRLHERNTQTESMFAGMEREKQRQTGDVTAAMHVKVSVAHPLGDKFAPVEVGVIYRKGAMEKVLPASAQEAYEEFKALVESSDANRVPVPTVSVDVRTASKARKQAAVAMSTVLGALNAVKANAADFGQAAASNPDFWSAWNSTPGNELAAVAALIHFAAKPVTRWLMNDNGHWLKMGALWKDTLDHVEYGDRLLNAANPLSKEIWNHLGQVLRASWGVDFNQELKAAGMQALRHGETEDGITVTPLDAINGLAGTVFERMNQQQRNALAMHKIASDNMRRLTSERIEELRNWKEAHPNDSHRGVNRAIEAHTYVVDSLGGQRKRMTGFDRAMAKLVANWMDNMFFWNLEFHGTNLTDAFIAGGSRVGPMNIWKAHAAFADSEIRTLFKHSNMVGGFRVDRANANAKAGRIDKKGFRLWFKEDVPSDLINADRVFLAHIMQYQQLRKPQLEKTIGFRGTDIEFAKQLLQGKIDPTVTMDVWTTGAEMLSRTLGVDPYNINANLMQQSYIGPVLGLFVKQPARVSRLAMQYLRQGEIGKFYTMMGYTMALGGRAALPIVPFWVYAAANPDSAFKAASAADSLNLYAHATGETLTPKLTWDLLWPVMAVANPLGADFRSALAKTAAGVAHQNMNDVVSGATSLSSYFLNKPKGLPVGQFLRAGKAVSQAIDGQKTLFAEDALGRRIPGSAQTVDLPTVADRVFHVARTVIPGKDPAQDMYDMSHKEADLNTWFGREPKDPDKQYYKYKY